MYIRPYYRNNFSSFIHQIDRIFENAFEPATQPAYAAAPINLYEKDDRYLASIDAPGFTKESFEIDVERSVIRVSAQLKSADDDSQMERSISRSFRLPETVDSANIQAKYENGVLALDLPKKPASVAQKITVT